MKTVMLAIALQAGLAGGVAPTPGTIMQCSERAPGYREGGVNDTTFLRGTARPPAQRRTAATPRALQTGAAAPRRAAARPITSPRDSASGLPTAR